MKEPTIISPQELLGDIRPLSATLYDNFIEATQIALPYFSGRQLPLNDILLSCMVRYEVKRLLSTNGVPVTDEEVTDDKDLPMEALALVGLSGFYKGYHFKVLKSSDGTLPVASSDTRRAFYGQQLEMRLPDQPDANLEPVHPNIVFLWRFDSSWTTMDLTVSVPRSGGSTRSSVKEYYRVSIPHPITTILVPRPQIGQEPIEEPPITIKETEIDTDSKNDIRRADTTS